MYLIIMVTGQHLTETNIRKTAGNFSQQGNLDLARNKQ